MLQRTDSGGRDLVMALSLAAALRRRLAETRPREAFVFETIERGMDSGHGDGAVALRFDFERHGRAVGVPAEAQQREEDKLLEFTEGAGGRHAPTNIYIVELTVKRTEDFRVQRKPPRHAAAVV
jgi:hypothetical protein